MFLLKQFIRVSKVGKGIYLLVYTTKFKKQLKYIWTNTECMLKES